MRLNGRVISTFTYALHVCVVKAFLCPSSSLFLSSTKLSQTSIQSDAGVVMTTRFVRQPPNGLGSWRVESILDNGQEQTTSMFVFLFDDGSGDKQGVQLEEILGEGGAGRKFGSPFLNRDI